MISGINPASIEELEISSISTKDGANFLLYDSGPDRRRILLFARRESLDTLADSKDWQADGTFKSVPIIFAQVYTIHAVTANGLSIPVVYALLTAKDTAMYRQLLQAIKQLNSRMNPKTIMVDFEKAAMKAFELEFPCAKVSGCLFHLSQSIVKNVQEKGLIAGYRGDQSFSLKIRCLQALAFAPVNMVQPAFEELTATTNGWPDRATAIADYFRDNYVGSTSSDGQVSLARFQPDCWNVLHRLQTFTSRTNNSVEGWHRGFNNLVGVNHVGFWRFVDALIKDEAQQRIEIVKASLGEPQRKRKRKYESIDERLRNTSATWGTRPTCDFLETIAMNLH